MSDRAEPIPPLLWPDDFRPDAKRCWFQRYPGDCNKVATEVARQRSQCGAFLESGLSLMFLNQQSAP